MSPARLRPALACALAAAAALGAAAGCPSGAGGSAGAGGATSTVAGSGGGELALCQSCFDGACKAQKAACNADCYGLQACLDAVCFNLSIIGAAAEEGQCQVFCQSLHAVGKQPQLDYVNCVQGTSCDPPCAGPPDDYDRCAAAQIAGPCKAAGAACDASSDCRTYRACASACTTYSDCHACVLATPAGEATFEAYQLCIDQACLATYWSPSP
jgi:hypothetical protein